MERQPVSERCRQGFVLARAFVQCDQTGAIVHVQPLREQRGELRISPLGHAENKQLCITIKQPALALQRSALKRAGQINSADQIISGHCRM